MVRSGVHPNCRRLLKYADIMVYKRVRTAEVKILLVTTAPFSDACLVHLFTSLYFSKDSTINFNKSLWFVLSPLVDI